MNPPFLFDSSSIRVLSNYYAERFPSFWQRFDEAVADGRVLSVREVYNELGFQLSGKWIWAWIESHKQMFLQPTAAEAAFVAQIFAVPHFRSLVGEMQRLKGRPVADPFVIASARVRGGCVVTEEANRPNAARIPNVCEHFGVHWTNVEGFLNQNQWTF
jgi:hypothetical protein